MGRVTWGQGDKRSRTQGETGNRMIGWGYMTSALIPVSGFPLSGCIASGGGWQPQVAGVSIQSSMQSSVIDSVIHSNGCYIVTRSRPYLDTLYSILYTLYS